jgi:hypothetical protein
MYDLRIQANQAKSRGKQQEQPLGQRVHEALLTCFSGGVSVERLVELMPSFSGPSLGNWAQSTHNEILSPLVDRGVIPADAPFQVWSQILDKRREDKFFSVHDAELVQIWGATFWTATGEQRTLLLETTKKGTLRAEGILCEPFLHSRNYDLWSSAANTVLWAMLRLWAILSYRPQAKDAGEITILATDVVRIVDGDELASTAIGEMKHVATTVLEQLRPLLAQGSKP